MASDVPNFRGQLNLAYLLGAGAQSFKTFGPFVAGTMIDWLIVHESSDVAGLMRLQASFFQTPPRIEAEFRASTVPVFGDLTILEGVDIRVDGLPRRFAFPVHRVIEGHQPWFCAVIEVVTGTHQGCVSVSLGSSHGS